jgi:hypothetical protein
MPEYSIQELLQEYIKQRKENLRPEQALKSIIQMQPKLPSAERHELAQAIRQWELKRPTGINIAIETPPAPVQETPAPKVAQPGLTCPHCGQLNQEGANFCFSCGQALKIASSQTGVLVLDDIEDPAIFGKMATLLIHIRGHEANLLRLQVEERPLIIGRGDPNAALQPDIDLMPYGAKDMGVSRHHATLQRANQTLTLFDEGSINHTFINGVKVHPHEVRVVRDGDEVRFGQLVTRFAFQRELRRLG